MFPQGLFAYSPAAFSEKCCMFLEKAQHVFRKGVACFWKERSLFFGKAQHLLSESLARPSRVGPVFPRAVAALFFDSLLAASAGLASFSGLVCVPYGLGFCLFPSGLRVSSVCLAGLPLLLPLFAQSALHSSPRRCIFPGKRRRFPPPPLPAASPRESALPYYICRKIPLLPRRKGKIAAEVPPFSCRARPEKV